MALPSFNACQITTRSLPPCCAPSLSSIRRDRWSAYRVLPLVLALGILATPGLGMQLAWADGGLGGASDRGPSDPGGTGFSGNPGVSSPNPSGGVGTASGGGGGGAGGGSGGNGRFVSGGLGGTSSNPDGSPGARGSINGGGGGGGGYNGNGNGVAILANPAGASLIGGNGGKGGDAVLFSSSGGGGGGGGGGGAGGYGAIVTGTGASSNGGSILGGAGGAGGKSGPNTLPPDSGGGGGDGGVGVQFTVSGTTLRNTGVISGGSGGAGGPAASAFGAIAGSAGTGGAGIVGAGLTVINSGTITGGLSGDGTIQADAILFTGGTNTLELDPGSAISGKVDATAGTGNTLVLGGTGSGTFNIDSLGTQYLGFSSLRKSGTSTFVLSGSSSYSGPLNVDGGMLTINSGTYTGPATLNGGTLEIGDAASPGAVYSGDVQVNAAGTLRGHGTVAGNVNNTGIVWPGGSVGTLTIGGNYAQSPSGTLQMEVSPTAASQLKVGGTANLAGTLSLLYAPGTYTTKTYTLVSANAVNGTFSTITGNTPANVKQDIAYAPNAVDLNLTSSGSTQPVEPAQPVVVAPTQATIFGAVGSSALRAGQGTNEALLDRLARPCDTDSLACPRQGNGLWIQAQGTDTRIDGNNGAPDAHDRRYGFLAGVDRSWKGWTVGVAGGYSHADVTESGNGSEGTLDTLRIAGYGAKNLGAYTLAGTLGYAYDFSSTTRSFGALGSAKGDGHGQEITAGLQASRAWSLGPVILTPRVGVRYAYLDGLSTDESGPTAQNLGVANQHLRSLQPYVGVTLDYPFTLRNSDRPASVQLRAGYAYETQNTGRNVSVTAADGTGFVIAGARDTRGLVTAGVGATLPIGRATSAYVRYDSVLHTGNVNAQSLQAGLDYRF